MSHFYASIEGQTSTAWGGSRETGISAHIRGSGLGVRVIGRAVSETCDCFEIYATGGSAAYSTEQLIGEIIISDGVPTFTPAARP